MSMIGKFICIHFTRVKLNLSLMIISLVSLSLFTVCVCSAAIDEVVVRVKPGTSPELLAIQHGMIVTAKLDRFPNTYVFTRISSGPKRTGTLPGMREDDSALHEDSRIEWAENQELLERPKRGPLARVSRFAAQNFGGLSRPNFKDPYFGQFEWYLREDHKLRVINMKISRAWEMGFTGKGVVVSVVDDGLEHNHTDIKQNYDPLASFDLNDNDGDPFPRYDSERSNSHGTRCAGEVAMVANNGVCGVGVAFNAKVGGIRLLDGPVTDKKEALALSYALDYIDIYNLSWGPSDNGATVDRPKSLAAEALEMGTRVGRKGRGAIYVWATGNGGNSDDNCNCDGYVSSIYTVAIGAVTQTGDFPYYGERCASTLAVAFSSGSRLEARVFTTTLHGECEFNHSGTSAAAPIAVGVIALLLESKPTLTWRDVKHLLVYTSSVDQLIGNRGWRRNAAGLLYNSRFGFGLIDAEALLKTASHWQSVGPMNTCTRTADIHLPHTYQQRDNLILLSTDGCLGRDNEVNSIEYVSIKMTLDTVVRGQVEIFLTSPSGTVSMLLSKRKLDNGTMFPNWAFNSVHFWGEQPRGTWQLYIRDTSAGLPPATATISSLSLIVYGTKVVPHHLRAKRVYPDVLEHTEFIDHQKEWDEENGHDMHQ